MIGLDMIGLEVTGLEMIGLEMIGLEIDSKPLLYMVWIYGFLTIFESLPG